MSISANIAEGNGRFSKNDRKHFFIVARVSLQECIPLLEIAKRKSIISEQQLKNVHSQLEVIAKMLSGLIKGLEKRKT